MVRLVRGIHESYPDRARAIVRSRVYTNTQLGASCRGIVKVSAKRVSRLPVLDGAPQWAGEIERVRGLGQRGANGSLSSLSVLDRVG